ncbi:hypothetical protein [Aeromicrobium sp.]|uniref:hypothetical protein n=1 Tax=Aeromicrobium sp. TaxID=1871063 RepID=UPI0019AA4848|nr:hypothetical protein [Aeromicrobium sp.]MBC7631999.1 hypothetical protein [Aeromicrobium sp.]
MGIGFDFIWPWSKSRGATRYHIYFLRCSFCGRFSFHRGEPMLGLVDPLVVVLGMHRSGTSALAGSLCQAGAWAGEAADLYGPTVANASGYFERIDTMAAVEALLERLGGSWDLPPLDALDGAMFSVDAALAGIFAAMRAAAPEGRIPLVKDPRLTLLSGGVRRLLGDRLTVALCVRHPLSVARSLARTERVPLHHGLALWETYNAVACTALAGLPVRMFSLEHALTHPQDHRRLVADVLAPLDLTEARLDAAVVHLRHELDHERGHEHEEKQWLTLAQRDLWHWLRGLPSILEPVQISPVAREVLSTARQATAPAVAAARAETGHVTKRLHDLMLEFERVKTKEQPEA